MSYPLQQLVAMGRFNHGIRFLPLSLALAILMAPSTVRASDVTTPAESVTTAATAATDEATESTSDTSTSDATNSEDTVSHAATTRASEETSTDARATTDPQATNSSSQGDCIEATFPDILGIGKCLGNDLNLCVDKNTATPGLLSLVNCTVIGVVQNLSGVSALLTIKDILIAIVNKLLPSVGSILTDLFSDKGGTSFNITDNACRGPIKIGFPNSLGKCIDDTLLFCNDGDTVNTSIIESLAKAVACLLTDLLTTNPGNLIKRVLCDVVRATGALFGDIFLGQMVHTAITGALC
ncbi:uncharacterized protein LOC144100308 isoform X2 [Amblyomma americanum]